jgi:alpha-amylase
MFADIDHKHPEVREDLFRWIEWLPTQVKLGGLRLDALKHYSFSFARDFVTHIQQHVDPSWFIVGEYWREDSEFLAKFIEFMDHRISLFDVQLVSNFSKVSMLQEKGDLRKVLDDSLALWKPENTVVSLCSVPVCSMDQTDCSQTFVVNHDTVSSPCLTLRTPQSDFD